jgi:hypothetical protein
MDFTKIIISVIVASTNVIPGILLVIFCEPIELFFKKIDEIPIISQFGFKGTFFSLPRKKFIKYLGIWLIIWGIILGFIMSRIIKGNSDNLSSDKNTTTLKSYAVSKKKICNGIYIATKEFSKVGYIKCSPDLEFKTVKCADCRLCQLDRLVK